MGGDGMPFVAAKGPLLNYLDARYSADGNGLTRGDRDIILKKLRTGWTVGDTMGGTIDTIPAALDLAGNPPGPPDLAAFFAGRSVPDGASVPPSSNDVAVALRRHLNRHWFGLDVDNATGHATTPTQPGGDLPTGWWRNWKGDAEGVFREGLIRAIEVSVGLNHGQDPITLPVSHPQPLPIDFTWICGAPRFEVYVNWRRVRGAGVVCVTFITPGSNSLPLVDNIATTLGVVSTRLNSSHMYIIRGFEGNVKD